MGISPDRFQPGWDGGPQSLQGLHNAGQSLGGGLLSGFKNLISGIGSAIGSLFTGGLDQNHPFYPVYVGIRDSTKPLIEKAEQAQEESEKATAAASRANTIAQAASHKAQEVIDSLDEINQRAQSAVSTAQSAVTTAQAAVSDAEAAAKAAAQNVTLELTHNLAQTNTRAISAQQAAIQANNQAVAANNQAITAVSRATEANNQAIQAQQKVLDLQQNVNAEQQKVNQALIKVDQDFERTRARVLVVPDHAQGSSWSLPGYVTLQARGGNSFNSKYVQFTALGNWTGNLTGFLKARNGAIDIFSMEVKNGAIDGATIVGAQRGAEIGLFVAGGTQTYVGASITCYPK